MAGYHGYSMSNNAVKAYNSGEKPLSRWTKSEMTDALESEDYPHMDAAKKLTVSEMRSLFLRHSSWHHTGKLYNRTDFYQMDPDNVTAEMIAEVIANREPKQKKEKPQPVKVLASWGIWEGTRKHPKLRTVTGYAVIVGNVAHIGGWQTKRTDGKHFQIIERYDRAPKGTAKEFKKIMEEMK